MLQNSSKIDLKYLFIAEFADGKLIQQTKEDCSKLPEGIAQSKSCFFDVLEYEKKSKLTRFWLNSVDGKNMWCVDLRFGIFVHNGSEFRATPLQFLPVTNPEYRLIYFRDVRRYQNNTYKVGLENDHVLLDQQDAGYDVIYYIGWQTEIQGKNYQQLVGVA